MFLAGLMLIIKRINSVQTVIYIAMRCVDWLQMVSSKLPRNMLITEIN